MYIGQYLKIAISNVYLLIQYLSLYYYLPNHTAYPKDRLHPHPYPHLLPKHPLIKGSSRQV